MTADERATGERQGAQSEPGEPAATRPDGSRPATARPRGTANAHPADPHPNGADAHDRANDGLSDGTHAGGRAVAERLGIDVALIELLVCPLGGGALVADAEAGVLISRKARLAYPVRDGVPILTPAEAEPIDEHDARLHPRRT